MKWTKIIGIVLFMHLFVISTLLVNPGCKWLPTKDTVSQAPRKAHKTSSSFRLSPKNTSQAKAESKAQPELQPKIQRPVQRSYPTRPEKRFRLANEPVEQETFSGIGFEQSTEAFNIIQPELPTSSEPTPPADTIVYTVVKGDTLSGIAKKYNVTLAELFRVNGLNKRSVLRIGQEVTIPDSGTIPSSTTSYTATKASTSPVLTGGVPYQVVKGDTLSQIAQRNQTTVSTIKLMNGLNNDRIFPGQKLMLPPSKQGSSYTKTTTTNTVSTQKTLAPEDGLVHTVQAGETPGEIAQRYGMRTEELMALNNINDPRKLRVGTQLSIDPQHKQKTVEIDNLTDPLAPSNSETFVETNTNPVQYSVPKLVFPKSEPVPEELIFEEIDETPIVPIETVEENWEQNL